MRAKSKVTFLKKVAFGVSDCWAQYKLLTVSRVVSSGEYVWCPWFLFYVGRGTGKSQGPPFQNNWLPSVIFYLWGRGWSGDLQPDFLLGVYRVRIRSPIWEHVCVSKTPKNHAWFFLQARLITAYPAFLILCLFSSNWRFAESLCAERLGELFTLKIQHCSVNINEGPYYFQTWVVGFASTEIPLSSLTSSDMKILIDVLKLKSMSIFWGGLAKFNYNFDFLF